jgi:hypothetical protein
MCNIDKHRRIPVHGTVVDFRFPAYIMETASFDSGGIMNVSLNFKDALKSHMRLNPEVPFKVVFGDSHAGIECDFDGIETICNFVAIT